MKKPNFFIIGAPKCGTTSLAAWLAEHPQIYMSPIKEPHHFNSDDDSIVKDREHYETLFRGAGDQHKAVGEASVWYLNSHVAVPDIERYVPSPQYIVCIRNPIEMAYSLHEQQIVNGNEHIQDFATAWSHQEERLAGKKVTRWCREPKHLAYGPACSIGSQLERLYTTVPKSRVLVIVLDDMKVDPDRQYRRVLRFLGVENDGRTAFPVLNTAKERRLPWLRQIVRFAGNIKQRVGLRKGFGVLRKIDNLNTRYRARQPLSEPMRRSLQEYFRDDVEKLGFLLERDFGHWLK
jgi:hypothetical protein